MPFVANMQSDEEKTDPTLAPQGAVAPTGGGGGAVRLSPSAAVAPAGSGAGGAPGSTPTPAAGGQFASLNQYLTANQGQAAPLTGRLTSGINQQYGNLDTANNAAIASINNQVTNAPGYTASNPNTLASEAANPVSFSSDPNNVKQFQSLLNNTYGGPTSAEGTADYTNQQNAVNKAIATGTANTATEAGRQNFLAQNEATPTAGVTALNSAIISQDPNTLSAVENAYKPFTNLLTNLNTGAQSADTTIGKEQTDAATSSKAASDAINSQIAELNTGVTGELTTAKQNAASQNARVKADLTAGTPSPADLQVLGITGDQWNALSTADKAAATAQLVSSNQNQFQTNSATAALDPSQFLTQQDPNAVFSTANVATPAEYEKAKAFQTLLQGMSTTTPAPILNQSTATQAGTAPTNLNAFDYNSAVSNAQTTAKDELATAQAYVDARQAGADVDHANAVARQKANDLRAAESIGGAAGTVAGGVIGSIIPGGGTVAGATVGGVAGTALGAGAYNTYADTKKLLQGGQSAGATASSAANVYADIASYGMYPAAKAIVNAVSCFAADTLVEMADGSTKPIQLIKVGDETRGGRVDLTLVGESTNLYNYKGIVVVGAHVVKEAAWKEVRHSADAFKLTLEEPLPVYCMCTSEHSIWINGAEFHDAISFAWFYLNFMKHDQHEAKVMLRRLAEKRND
jgi:hypothetical protein